MSYERSRVYCASGAILLNMYRQTFHSPSTFSNTNSSRFSSGMDPSGGTSSASPGELATAFEAQDSLAAPRHEAAAEPVQSTERRATLRSEATVAINITVVVITMTNSESGASIIPASCNQMALAIQAVLATYNIAFATGSA